MEIKNKFKPDPKLKLMDQVRQVLRYHHYSLSTEKTYCDWISRYIKYHRCKRHPSEMGKREIEDFLSHLATDLKVSASTQRQALNAIVFLYKLVLDISIDEHLSPIKAKKHHRPLWRAKDKMFKPKFAITPKINKALVEIERVRGFLDAVKLKDEWIADMQKNALILESHHSTHIEGTALTLEQAKSILEGKKLKGINPDDEKELLNYKKAMDFTSKYLGKDDPVTEGVIREIHKVTVKGVRGGQADPGNYRKVQNYIVNSRTREVIYTSPVPLEVPHLMREFAEWLNKAEDMSPILVAGIAQFQFVHIHPFIDGNGRTARLLSTLILYKTGYDFKRLFTISEYYDKDRPAYYKVIQSVRENNMDMTAWLEYFVDGLRSQMAEIYEKGKQIIIADNTVKLLEDLKLNIRQEKIIRYLVINEQIDNTMCQKICNSIKRTVTRDLTGLVEKDILKKIGEKKGTYYILSSKVIEKIRDIKGHR